MGRTLCYPGYMDTHDAITLPISPKPPKFLDESGRQITPDPLLAAWKTMEEVFSQLQGQRLVELMQCIFSNMPDGEILFLEEEQDETVELYFRFSNGWSIGNGNCNPDEPNRWRFDTNDAIAPEWFPRDKEGLARWMHWHDLLNHATINSKVDYAAQCRLIELSQAKGGLKKQDLPEIAQALISKEWQAKLDGLALAQSTPNAQAIKPKARM